MDGKSQASGTTMQLTGKRVRRARLAHKMTQTELARQIGTSASQISMLETSKSGTSLKTAMAVAKALEVSLDYLAGWVKDPTPTRVLLMRLDGMVTKKAQGFGRKYTGLSHGNFEAPGTYVSISEIDASAGPGAMVYGEDVAMVKFPQEWLREHRLSAASCRIIRVRGESMEPTLPHHSMVLVDLTSEEPKDGRIFVIRTGEELIVKRLAFIEDVGWLLESDNPERKQWPTRLWPDDAEIVGEVRWVGRSLP